MKTTTQHTPGPWQISADGQRVLDSDGEGVLATVYGAACADQDGAANARLIAAAPDLLAALQNAANVLAALATGQLKSVRPDSPALAKARVAISKAEGNP
jgi:hypothetical protein